LKLQLPLIILQIEILKLLKKGTPASPAIAFANKVFPVPGEPPKRTPFGIPAPNFEKLAICTC
jgi:hypothetical protein